MTPKTIQARVTRRFAASAERVFDAFLDPAKAGRFMFTTPTGQMVRVEIDPRVGGRFNFVDRRDGEDVEHSGEYLEIDRPRRLVFTISVPKYSQNVDRVTIDITALASGCELTLVHEMGAEFAEMRPRTEAGWAGILDGLGAVVGEAAGSSSNDEQEIRALVATWMSATRAGDLDTVLDLMTEDAVFLGPGRPPMMGRESFAAASRAQAENSTQIDGTSEIQEIRVAGDCAYMWTRLSVVMTPAGGKAIKRAGHTLSVLRKENGKWRLARDANMLSVVPE
jgi:uncharacterized protein (TIGR02246 family)